MSYIDGFVIPVPNGNRQAFIDHAKEMDQMFLDLGATRIFECWGDDVPEGKTTDFARSVQLAEGETVVLSFIEWPDKDTRQAAWSKMEETMKDDPRFDPEKNPPPFDGRRLIYGGFDPVVVLEKEHA